MYTQASGFFMWQFSLKVQAIKVYRLARPMFHQACYPWYFPSHCCAKLWHISHCQTLTLAKVSHGQKLASKFKVTEIIFNVSLIPMEERKGFDCSSRFQLTVYISNTI